MMNPTMGDTEDPATIIAGLEWHKKHEPDAHVSLNFIERDAVLVGLKRLERLLQASDTALAFFRKHGLGPLAAPSCFMCGEVVPGAAAVRHMELPGVVGCARCAAACDAAKPHGGGPSEC